MTAEQSADVFERMTFWGLKKIQLACEHPEIYRIIFMAYYEVPEELQAEMQQRYNKLFNQSMPVFIQGIDYSKFRKGIEPAKAIEVIFMVLEGLGRKYLTLYKDRKDRELYIMEKALEEYMTYMDIIKDGIYEREQETT